MSRTARRSHAFAAFAAFFVFGAAFFALGFAAFLVTAAAATTGSSGGASGVNSTIGGSSPAGFSKPQPALSHAKTLFVFPLAEEQVRIAALRAGLGDRAHGEREVARRDSSHSRRTAGSGPAARR